MKRIMRSALAILAFGALMLVLEACSGNQSVSTTYGYSGSRSSDWGNSITFGVHTHGRGW